MILATLAGCVIGGDKYPRPRDLEDDWSVTRTRLLGVASEPAEARPGDRVTFEALFGHPPGDPEALSVVWLACPVTDDTDWTGGCATDFGAIDFDDPDPAALAELGFIGFEPGLPPAYQVPADLLDGLDDAARLEGVYVMVQLFALPPAALEDPENLDFAEVESGYKRLVVSEAATPNHNPPLGAFTVDGSVIPAGATVHLDRLQPYELGVVLAEGAIETYDYLTSDGAVEVRVEEPYVSWFATGGELIESVTLWPSIEATWVSPPAEGQESDFGGDPVDSGTWYAVLRDRRGGMSWLEQPWVIDP
ncbi:MAG: hypothetical protein ABMA64_04905 [Myxococcota bacterium]